MNPTHNGYDAAESLKLFDGMTLKILLSSSDTNGLQAVFEDIVEHGLGPGRHIHHKQDETLVFIEGTFDVEIDGQLYRMSAGDTAFIPKGTIHGSKNVGDKIGRLRYIQYLLGHSSCKTTELYTHITQVGLNTIKNPLHGLDIEGF